MRGVLGSGDGLMDFRFPKGRYGEAIYTQIRLVYITIWPCEIIIRPIPMVTRTSSFPNEDWICQGPNDPLVLLRVRSWRWSGEVTEMIEKLRWQFTRCK